MSETTQVANPLGNILPANIDPKRIEQVFQDNFDEIRFGDLDRISTPSGGGIQWKFDTIDGKKYQEEVLGVIVSWNIARSYFLDQDSQHVSCFSPDGKKGIGDPGGRCDQCSIALFVKDKAPECKEQRALYILTPEGVLPYHLMLPPTSIPHFRKYMVRLGSRQLSFWEVQTSITLKEDTSKGGIDYSYAQFKPVRILTEAERNEIANYRYSFSKRVTSTIPTQEEEEEGRAQATETIPEAPPFDIPSDHEIERQLNDDVESAPPAGPQPGPPRDPLKPKRSNDEILSEMSWKDAIPANVDNLKLFAEALSKRFYIRMSKNNMDHDSAKKWLLGIHKLPPEISAKDILEDADLIKITNRAYFQKFGEVLFIHA
ncbi:MAG TPA: hypothetical protein ENI23_06805 [bacterium]|nr:hypothetical protein [bacterium]